MQKRVIFVAILSFCFLLLFLSGYAVGRVVKTKEINLEKEVTSKQVKPVVSTNQKNTLVGKNRLNPEITSLPKVETSDKGYSFRVETKNFYFTPESFGKAVSQNTGIAEVLVNKKLFTYSYNQNFFIPENIFSSGTNTVEVYLLTNDGSRWQNNKTNSPISTSTDIFIK